MAFGKREQRIDFLRLSLTLFAITSVVAILLAVANYFTAPIIERSAKERLESSLMALMDGAGSFEKETEYPKEITTGGVNVPVKEVYRVKNRNGAFLGFCIRVAPAGYTDVIDMIIAVDQNGTVAGVDVLEISDTPGIGMKVEQDETFKNSVLGLSQSFNIVTSLPTDQNEVQVIAGATISSKGYLNGVNAAIDVAEQLLQEVK